MIKAWAEVKQGGQRVRDEVKRPEQIEKARKMKEKARLRGNKEVRIKLQQKQKKPTLKTKQKKGGKRRRWTVRYTVIGACNVTCDARLFIVVAVDHSLILEEDLQ